MANAWELYKKTSGYKAPVKTKTATALEQAAQAHRNYYAEAQREEEERRRQNRAMMTQVENEAAANRFGTNFLPGQSSSTPMGTPQIANAAVGMKQREQEKNEILIRGYARDREAAEKAYNQNISRAQTSYGNTAQKWAANADAMKAKEDIQNIDTKLAELGVTPKEAAKMVKEQERQRGSWLGDVAKSAAKDSASSSLANFASGFAGAEGAYKGLQNLIYGKAETPDTEKNERDYAVEYLQEEINKQEWEITKLQKQVNVLAPEDPQRETLARQLRSMEDQLRNKKSILARIETYYSEAAYDTAAQLKREGAQDIQRAYKKAEGVPLGKLGTDITAAGLGMVADVATGAITGVTPLTAAAIRAAGSANLEAKSEGASNASAAVRGALEAVKVSLIGRISNVSGIAQKFSGKTAKLDGIVEAAIAKLAQNASSNPVVQRGLNYLFNALASGAGEGAEEMLETFVDPALDALSRLDAKQMSEYGSGEYWGQLLYDGLVGGIMGLAGGALDVGKMRGSVSETPKTVTETPENVMQSPRTATPEVNTPMGAEAAQRAEKGPVVSNIEKYTAEYDEILQEYQARTKKAMENPEGLTEQGYNEIIAMENRLRTLGAVINAAKTKTAPTEGAESTAVNDNPAQHTPAEQQIIEEYKNSSNDNLLSFYQRAKYNQNAGQFNFGTVTSETANDIRELTGNDVEGFAVKLDARQAWHINNDHGANGKADRSMADDNDVARMEYVLANYDSVEHGGTTDAYWEPKANGKNRQAQTVVFSKKVNGTYYVVEAVPVTKAKSVYVVSAYMVEDGKTPYGRIQNKKRAATQLPDASAPWFTANTDSAHTAQETNDVSISNVSQRSGEVNSVTQEDMNQAVEDIGNVLVSSTVEKDTPSLREELGKTARFVYRKMVDAGEAVQRIAKATGDKYLYAYYNMARASTNAASSMITDAQTDIAGNETGKSLDAIFEPIKAKGEEYYNDFQKYLFNMHNIDRMGGAREVLTRRTTQKLREFEQSHPELMRAVGGDGRKLVEMSNNENSPFYADALKLVELRNAVNRAANMMDKPVLSSEVTADDSRTRVAILVNRHPEFPKLAEEVYKYSDNLLKYRVDSGLITQEQYETYREMYPHYVPTYRKKDGASTDTRKKGEVKVGKTVQKATGGDSGLMPIDASLARQTYSVVREGAKNRFGQRLLEHSTTDEKGHNLIVETNEYEQGFDPEDIDAARQDIWKQNNTFVVYKDGKQVDMTVSPELYEGIKVLAPDQEQSNIILRGGSAINNAYKQLITGLNPTFAVRNFIRDLQDAGLNSKDIKAFAENYPLALQEIKNNGKYWQKYKALGGTYSTIFDYETGQMQKDSPLKEKTLGKVEALNMAIEQAPRLAEFMATVKKGDGSLDNLMEAMLASADVTTNFGRSGTWGKNLNRYLIPFFNPSVQGLDKFVRVFTETKGAKQWLGLVGKAALFGITPGILNELIYREDDEWDDMRQSDKDTNYMFKLKDGLWLKIPKGRALSIFGMLGGRGMNIAQGDYEDFADFLKTGALTFAETAGTQMAPSNPLQENILRDWFNTELFNPDSPGRTWYGSDIENQRMQSYAPGERYDAKTDEISKWLGQKTGLSPKKINYLLNQYTGVIGDIVLPLLTPAAERDMFSAAFTVDTNYSNELSERFYGKLDELTYAKNKTGSTPADAATLRYWNKVSSAVGDINAAIREVEESTELSAKDKKEKIALLYAERNALERSALNSFDAYAETAEGYYSDWVRPEGLTDEKAAKKATEYAYLMANKEILGAEYAIETYDKEIYLTAQNLNSLGVSYEDFFDYYFTAKDMKATKQGNVTIIPEGNKKREYLASMDISAEAKRALYNVFISDTHEDDIYRITTTGIDFNDYLFIQNKYSEINEKNLSAANKTLEFERWMDSEGFNARQEKAIQESFKFYSMTPAETDNKYDELTELGISADKAEELVKQASTYDMQTSKEKLQFYRLAVSSVSSKKDRLNALTPWLTDSDLVKCTYAYESGIDPAIWVTFKEQMYDKTTQAQAKYVIDGLVGLDKTQRAILWQLADKGWKSGRNPYSVQAGQKVYDFMHQED